VRPSEKTGPNVIPGFPRKAIQAWIADPSEGRAPHARNGTIAPPRHVPGWPPRHRQPSGENEMPSLASGLTTRTHGVRPSEKTAPGVIPGFPRKAIPARMTNPAEGRAPHARNIRIATYRNISPFGHQLLAKSSVIMLCPGLRPALPNGRAGRAPPRTPTSALCQGFPRKAILPWMAHPSEGRAPHARKRGFASTGGSPL
jgi:hypothetical protein